MSDSNCKNNRLLDFVHLKGGMIGKLFVYQIAMSLFGLFVISPFNGGMQLFASIFSSLFYFSLVCYAVIEDGQKDHISSVAGRLKGNPYSGFVYALISYFPTIIILLVTVILSFVVDPFVPSAGSTVLGILNTVIRFFLMGMYLGFDTGLVIRQPNPETGGNMVVSGSEGLVFLSDHCLIFAICLILLPLICGTTYYLAFKGKIHVDTAVKQKKSRKDKHQD